MYRINSLALANTVIVGSLSGHLIVLIIRMGRVPSQSEASSERLQRAQGWYYPYAQVGQNVHWRTKSWGWNTRRCWSRNIITYL